ncbi:hypothetical protein KY363_03280, partial [Candidatus Woesearchaeota archaeon]|nr:hypothetical protein [Candidatus Woesearchaeota archaeon]
TGLTALRLAITVGTTLAVLGALYLISGAYQRAPIIRDITLLMLYITLGGAALLAIIAILADSRKNAGKTPPAPTPRHKEPHKNIPKPAIMTTVMHAEKKIADTAEKTAKEAGNGMHKISALISRASRNAYRSITEAAHRSTRRIHESVQATHKNIRRRYAAQRAMQKEKDIMQRLEQAKKAEEERRAAAKKELEKLQEMLKEQKGKLDEADAGLKAVTEKLENKKAEKRNILASLGRIEKQMKHVRLSPDLQKEIDSEIARIHAGMKDIDSGIAALEKEHDEAAQKKAKMLAEERITENAVKEQRRKLHA